MGAADKPLVWLHGEIQTPPLSKDARVEAGFRLRFHQQGRLLSLPYSRPMPAIAKHIHELRILDTRDTWRVVYRLDPDAIVILEVFSKKTRAAPLSVIRTWRRRLAAYDALS